MFLLNEEEQLFILNNSWDSYSLKQLDDRIGSQLVKLLYLFIISASHICLYSHSFGIFIYKKVMLALSLQFQFYLPAMIADIIMTTYTTIGYIKVKTEQDQEQFNTLLIE